MISIQKKFTLPSLFVFSFFLFFVAACGVNPSSLSMSLSSSKPVPGTTLLTYKGHNNVVGKAIWSPDGKQVASVDFSDVLQKWDATTGKTLWTVKVPNSYSLSWSHDGKHIAVGTFATNTPTNATPGSIKILDAQTGKIQQTFLEYGSVADSSWSLDDKSIVTASDDGNLRIRNSSNGQIQTTIRQHGGPINAVAYSPDGKSIAFAAEDSGHNIVYVYDVKSGKENPFFYGGHSKTITSLSWSPDSKSIASSSQDKTVTILNAFTLKTLVMINVFQPVLNAAYSHDGKQIVVATVKAASTYNASTGAHLITYTGHSAFVYDAQWSSDDQRIATASADFTVKIWQAR